MSNDDWPLWQSWIRSWRVRIAVALSLAIVLIALAVAHHSGSTQERGAYTYLARTNYWIASQLEMELIKFLSAADRFVLADGEISRSDMLLQFDLLWSRVPVFLNGPEAAAAREVDGASATVTSLLADLQHLESAVGRLTPGDAAGRRLIDATLAPYKPLLHDITLEVAIGKRRQELIDRIDGLEDRRFLLEITILGTVLALTLLLLFEIYRSRRQTYKERQLREATTVASQAKSRFLATMSHELRTPLNAVIGFAELMTMEMLGPLGAPAYQQYADSILTSAHRLLSVLNDVLDIAHLEAGKVRLEEELFDPCAAVETCVELLRTKANEKAVKVTSLLDRPAPLLRGDPRLFKQTCLNIAGNAIKFSPTGSHVIITCSRAEGELELVVEDNGPGIASDALAHVTDAFHQVDADLNRRNEGCGLGLTLAKAFVELHDGRLNIESRLGLGTRVSARFPSQRLLTGDSAAA